MGISFGSINTGLPKDIVKKLIDAERIPIQKMEIRKSKIQEKKKLVETLIKLVEDIRVDLQANKTARNLREIQVSTNDDIIDVDIDKNSIFPGNYQIEVIELAQKSSALSSGFENPDDSYIGVGYLKYNLPNGDTKEVFVDADNSSLRGIANLINNDSENGLSATVLNDGADTDNPWRLNLALTDTGDDNKATWPHFYFVDGDDDFFLEFTREAKDAKVKFNGFEVEFPSNKLKSLIPGAVINLKRAKAGEEFSINISEDTEAISEKIEGIVTKVNDVLSFIKKQNTLNESTDTTRTLGGDLILQSLEGRIRGVIFTHILTDKGYKRIGDFGVSFQKSGLIQIDPKKIEKSMSEDYATVSQLMVGIVNEDGIKEPGFIDNLEKLVSSSLQIPNGLLRSRKNSIQSNVDRIDRRIQQKERFIAQKETNLKRKFATLESTISRIRSQGAGLAALGNQALNPVHQLG